MKQVDMIFSDGDQGSAFIITSVSNTMPELKKLVWDMLIAILMILVLTGALLSAWIYRGINTPLQKLREATQHIKAFAGISRRCASAFGIPMRKRKPTTRKTKSSSAIFPMI